METFKKFVGRERKVKRFFPLVLLRGTEVVVQNRNGKALRADRRSESACGGLKRKGCTTSGTWPNK